MRAPVRVEPGLVKEAPGGDDAEYTENDRHRRGFGKISDVSQVMRFLPKCVAHGLFKTLKIIEW